MHNLLGFIVRRLFTAILAISVQSCCHLLKYFFTLCSFVCTVRERFSGLDTAIAAQQRQDRSVCLGAFHTP